MRFVLAVLLIGCSAPAPTKGGGGPPAPDHSEGKGPANVDCRMRIALRCGQGKVDGCGGGKTTIHICIREDEQPGPPCAQEILKQCPSGQTDACVRTPQAANTHICVF